MKQGYNIAHHSLQRLQHQPTGPGPAGHRQPAVAPGMGPASKVPQRNPGPQAGTRQPDLFDAVNIVFMMMRDAFPQQFLKAWPTEQDRKRAQNLWARALRDQEPRQLKQAIFRLIREERFLPTLNRLRRRCQVTGTPSGMPTAHAAWQEACQAACQSATAAWSHLAVYLAGRETGWYLLNTEPRAVSFPPFERNYSILCDRVAAGESLEEAIPKALPAPTAADSSARQLHAEMLSQGINPDGGHAEFLKELDTL